MKTVLVTGASGFIGRALSVALAEHHNVICMSRNKPGLDLPWVPGDFGAFEDLRHLDDYSIEAVIHLAAVTPPCSDREAILVNAEGTRVLMRYLVDRGCTKFVMTSSIAAVGFQSPMFRPVAMPIPDEHPCLDRDSYGFSKYLMEEISRHCHLQNPAIDVINLRLSSVTADDRMPVPHGVTRLGMWALGGITVMALSDAVRVFTLAAEAPHKAAVRTMNAAGPRAWTSVPVAEVLRNWWGAEIDLSHFEQPGHAYDSVFDVRRIEAELGFVAAITP